MQRELFRSRYIVQARIYAMNIQQKYILAQLKEKPHITTIRHEQVSPIRHLLVIQHQKELKLLHMLILIQTQMFFQEQIYELLKI